LGKQSLGHSRTRRSGKVDGSIIAPGQRRAASKKSAGFSRFQKWQAYPGVTRVDAAAGDWPSETWARKSVLASVLTPSRIGDVASFVQHLDTQE